MERLFSDKMIKSIREQSVEVESFLDVDLRKTILPIIALFENPEDYPECCVARLFDGERATDIVLKAETLGELREDIGIAFPYMNPIKRCEGDVRSFVEAWI